MKRTKVFATIITLCLAISTLAYGVYAATNLSFGITANFAFVVDNVFFELQMNIKGAYDQGGTALGDLNYNYNTTGVANPRVTYSDATLVTETMLNTWVNSLTIPALYFNPDAITPIELEVIVRNHTPNKNIVVEICEWDTTGVGSKIEPENSALYQYAEIFEMPGMGYNYIDTTALTGDALTDEIENQTAVATYEYELLSLATPITTPIQRNWKISINGYNVETSTGDNPAFTIVDGTGDNAGQKILTAYSGTNQAMFVPREVTNIAGNEIETRNAKFLTMSNTPSVIGNLGFCFQLVEAVNLRGCTEMRCTAFGDITPYLLLKAVDIGKINCDDNMALFSGYPVKNIKATNNANFHVENRILIKGNVAWDCPFVKNVKIPSSITAILDSFACLNNLIDNLDLSTCTNLTTIGRFAFCQCTSLTSITLPNSVTSIGDSAFKDCSSLTEVVINSTSLTTYGSSAFEACHANVKIYVPDAAVDTYKAGWSAYASKIYGISERPVV